MTDRRVNFETPPWNTCQLLAACTNAVLEREHYNGENDDWAIPDKEVEAFKQWAIDQEDWLWEQYLGPCLDDLAYLFFHRTPPTQEST